MCPPPFSHAVTASASPYPAASAIASPTDLIKIRCQKDTTIPIPSFMTYVRAISAQPGGPIMPFYEGVSLTITRAVVLGATKMTVYNEVRGEAALNAVEGNERDPLITPPLPHSDQGQPEA